MRLGRVRVLKFGFVSMKPSPLGFMLTQNSVISILARNLIALIGAVEGDDYGRKFARPLVTMDRSKKQPIMVAQNL